MNFHSDEWIMERLQEHYNEALEYFPEDRIVGIFLQGSQNYGLDYEYSDVDTKLIVTPTFEEIAMNKQPSSTTHVRENDEHIDFKDIRLYTNTFRKQNINFLEILFTPYKITNPLYASEWNRLVEAREDIAHYNPYRAVKALKGMAMEKYHALKHPYPSKIEIINKYGYDCYDEHTKFLTQHGWKMFDEITKSDKLATINPNTQCLEWQNYLHKIKKLTFDPVYDVETVDTHFRITGTHNVYTSNVYNINKNGHKYIKENASWNLSPLIEAKSKGYHKHLFAFPYNNNDDYPVSDDTLKLIGAYISEGTINFRHNQPQNLRITQTINGKNDFFEMMDSISSYNDIHKYNYEKETVWIFNSETAKNIYEICGHGSKNKRLPEWYIHLSVRQCNILLDALLLGDGCFYNNRNVYYTSNQALAEDVFTLSLLGQNFAVLAGGENGYCSNGKFGEVNMWHVHIKNNRVFGPSYFYCKDGKNIHITDSNKSQTVVCFEVPNGTLVTMFNGKPAVQGNCKQLHHLLRLEEFLDRYISGESYTNCLIPTNIDFLKAVKLGLYNLKDAEKQADRAINNITAVADRFTDKIENIGDPKVDMLLDDVQVNIMKIAIRNDIEK